MNTSLPPRALRAHASPPKLVVTASAVASALGYLLWLRVSGAGAARRSMLAAALFIAFDAALVVLFWRASMNDVLVRRTRRALRLLAATAALGLVGRIFALVPLVTGAGGSRPLVADLFLLAIYPVTLAAFLSFPLGARTTDRWKLLFDGGMVVSGVGAALWYFVLRDTAASGIASPLGVTLALVYPLADLLILVTIVTLLLRGPVSDHRHALGWLAISAALGVADDLFRSLLLARAGPFAPVWADALHFAAAIALVASAELFLRASSYADRARGAHPAGRLSFVSTLPFLAAASSYALLADVAVRNWVSPVSELAIGAIVVSCFLGARQLLAMRQQAMIVAEATLRASEARFRSLVQQSSDLIFVLDARGVIQFASSSASRIIGYGSDSLIGVALSALSDPEDSARVSAFIEMTAQLPGVSPLAEWRLRRPDGLSVEVEAVASNLLDDAAVGGIVLNARDVGERKALLDQLAHQAFHDPLTGLANRALFRDRVTHAITLARRQGRAVTVLYLDLDDFKQVNDSLGHAEGDRLLSLIAARLRACARSTDTVARLGGDEFAVLVEDADSAASAERLVERILEQMSYPFTLGQGDMSMSASIGSASTVGDSLDEVLRYADVAMYAAKRSGRGLHRAFEMGMLERR